MLIISKNISDFEGLLEILKVLSGGRKVTLDPSFAESSEEDTRSPDDGVSSDCGKQWKQGARRRCVQFKDLVSFPRSSELSDEGDNTNLFIWISAHVAVIEVILRIYLSQQITQKRLNDALRLVVNTSLVLLV